MYDQQKKLKIVYLVARFHPFKGGAEQNCLQLAKRAAAEGHSVTVFTTNISPTGEPLPSQESYLGIDIVRFKAWNKQLNLGFYPGLFPTLLSTKADVIHVENGPGFLWHEFCLFWKRLFARKTLFIATPHGGFLATPETHSGIKLLVAKAAKTILAPYFKILWPFIFDVVIAVNPKQIEWLKRDYRIPENKITVIPNGIDASLVITPEQLQVKKQSLIGQPLTITGIGRMAKYKGFQYAIQALAKLKAERRVNKPVRLVIMGKRESYAKQLAELKDELSLPEVELITSPDDTTLYSILTDQSQINLLPSHFEATGISLLDAMSKGNAIVTSDGNEAAELLITNSENGFIFRSRDVDDLADKLETLINNDDLRWKTIEHNLEKVKSFTWEQIFPVYNQLIHKLIPSK